MCHEDQWLRSEIILQFFYGYVCLFQNGLQRFWFEFPVHRHTGMQSVFGVMAMRSGLPHELKAQSFQRAAASCHLRRQHGVLQKVQPDRPVQALIIFSEPALDQIADHRQQFIESLALRRHFRLVAGGDEHSVVRLLWKDELFLHATLYAKADGFAKVEMTAILKTKRRGRSPALKFAGEI